MREPAESRRDHSGGFMDLLCAGHDIGRVECQRHDGPIRCQAAYQFSHSVPIPLTSPYPLIRRFFPAYCQCMHKGLFGARPAPRFFQCPGIADHENQPFRLRARRQKGTVPINRQGFEPFLLQQTPHSRPGVCAFPTSSVRRSYRPSPAGTKNPASSPLRRCGGI